MPFGMPSLVANHGVKSNENQSRPGLIWATTGFERISIQASMEASDQKAWEYLSFFPTLLASGANEIGNGASC